MHGSMVHAKRVRVSSISTAHQSENCNILEPEIEHGDVDESIDREPNGKMGQLVAIIGNEASQQRPNCDRQQ